MGGKAFSSILPILVLGSCELSWQKTHKLTGDFITYVYGGLVKTQIVRPRGLYIPF